MKSCLSSLIFVMYLFTCQLSWGQTVTTRQSQIDTQRLKYAKGVISEFGDRISPQVQKDILEQRVTIGMHPNEAYLAAGAFSFKVVADPEKWPQNADPYKVMEAQTLHPDDSEIWMNFQTATQFLGKGMTSFQIFIKGGVVREIAESDGQSAQ